ncbi:MAG: cysteine desulfurase NifS [bacterium]
MRKIYLDNAATTPVHPEVREAVLPYLEEYFGNPSSIHYFGREVKKAIDLAREQVAALIGAKADEIIFTSGATESDNYAILGIARAKKEKGNHIITSAIEHHAVLDTCESLKKEGFEVTVLPVDSDGLVNPADVRAAITDKTILITIMHANNEIGTIQPIKEIGAIAKEKGVLFHVDAVQTVGQIPVNVDELQVDLMSLSGHKMYGIKGSGALYVRKGVRPEKIIFGGAQERKKRAGTENIVGIVALGKAAEIAKRELPERIKHNTALREKLIKGILDKVPYVILNGHREKRLPGNVNFCFEYIEGESLLMNLDFQGIAGSTGSACTSGSLSASHVLLAIGLSPDIAPSSLRLTIGRNNTEEDIDYVLDVLPKAVEKLRMMSPTYPG